MSTQEIERQDQALFDQIALQYGQKDRTLSSSIARKGQLLSALQPLLKQTPSLGTVVDIGCGVGAPAQYLQGFYDHYIGVDQSSEMIRVAEVLNQPCNKTQFVASNIKAMTLPDHIADVVLVVGALHHMTDLEAVMGCLVKLAKPGAYLMVIEPQKANPLIQGMRWLRTKIDRGYSEDQIFFSEQELVDLLHQHNISIHDLTYRGFLSPPFAEVIIPPQFLSRHLSQWALTIDRWFDRYLPQPLHKLSFNICITGVFPQA
ncbi:2-methyl-6-phytyl-1,4-hydroquinone methyltransferase [Acaryochloris thomasi RCC1774]|uniref:2-methyl-6-phytyl-1,4-hydroquinone methyltransferase n=1 Tax=Acaryochloris thomasi RCC1774 TaxID=1764569 RepID=A0A2W1JUW9_9CYAN|nr:class I SAM-dependent methyltransferase [Acaryochloris thomasi]PZD74272.1 2-methyl-6-phytyl-1,4-hydroquinone methyltransferase [Acaryochloris thomasi RCC1774]